jgi:hypothetical protein
MKTKALRKGLLDQVRGDVWMYLAIAPQPVQHWFTELGWVPVSPIVQGCIAMQTNTLEQSVSGGATDLYICECGRLFPRMACLHERNQALFRSTLLFLVHESFLAFNRFTKKQQSVDYVVPHVYR